MILEYVEAAMRQARCEWLPEDQIYYGEIPGFNGVYASSAQLEDCREELKSVLEDWLLFSVHKNLPVPMNRLSLEIKNVA